MGPPDERRGPALKPGPQRSAVPQIDSVDVDQADDDSEPAGHVNRQEVVVPSQRHLELYRLLRSNSHRDQAGRLVSWWTQPKLAASLGVSVRTLRNLLADLRQPGLDPRHPRGQPPGLRLGLVRVEATTYRDQATGCHRPRPRSTGNAKSSVDQQR